MKTLANHIVRLVSVAALSLLLAGTFSRAARAQSAPEDGPHGSHARHGLQQGHAGTARQPVVQDGVQVVEINVTARGYTPQRITLQPNVPVKLVFTRTEKAGCTDTVQIPAFGIERTSLPLGQPVTIAFTPREGGEFSFACGMDMVKGTLLVKS